MRIKHFFKAGAARERASGSFVAAALIAAGALAGCASSTWREAADAAPAASAADQASARPAGPQGPTYPFPEAVARAADTLLASAPPPAGTAPRTLVIDPLIDDATGFRSAATQSMQAEIVRLARSKYPQYDVQDLTETTVAAEPLVLLGSLAGAGADGAAAGSPGAYRIWLVLADLKTGRIVARGTANATPGGVDTTPVAADRDAPGWSSDPATEGYLKTCGGKPGDPIDPTYLEGVRTAALVRAAADAYDAGRYQAALDLYERASKTAAGDQLRVHNGLYLANWTLGRREDAAAAFGDLVDYGLRNDRLAIRFLFKPATTTFWPPALAEPYPMWLEQLARRAAGGDSCLEVTGHTSPSGPEPLNERLSLRRAEYIMDRLREDAPQLGERMIANGVGSRQSIVGTGKDDATDALDRRVEFRALSCSRRAGLPQREQAAPRSAG